MTSGREAPGSLAGLDLLPEDVLRNIAQLGFIEQLSPMYDRGDLLQQACTLACVGNDACTTLAGELFAVLSPRLGEELPNGVTQHSSAAQLKVALKEWRLPLSGNKAELWQRLLDQVRDSVGAEDDGQAGSGSEGEDSSESEDEDDGEAKREQQQQQKQQGSRGSSCLVSGATRRELTGWCHKRISLSKAKEVFQLWKFEVEQLPHMLEQKGRAPAVKTYLLSDVKRLAWARHASWDKLVQGKQASKEQSEAWEKTYKEQQEQRAALLRAELASRGYTEQEAEDMMGGIGSGSVTWGGSRELAPPAAINLLERLRWASSGDRGDMFLMAAAIDSWQPPRGLAQYKVHEKQRERAADAVVRMWAQSSWRWGSLQELRGDPRVPRSLLPELERLWQTKHVAEAAQVQATT